MKILKSVVTVCLDDGKTRLKRVEYVNTGIVDWTSNLTHKEYKIEDGVWSVFDPMAWNYSPLTEKPPTWEQEYQEALLAQYPFEKRVREIISTVSKDTDNRVNHIMCEIADDVDFEDLVSEYLAKT